MHACVHVGIHTKKKTENKFLAVLKVFFLFLRVFMFSTLVATGDVDRVDSEADQFNFCINLIMKCVIKLLGFLYSCQ